eukprot:gb/GFBE01043745.1/.p1 GENE.gb/GFBE01043745.1/~~gb/GFBE01043745.1/.p1  ORF type:complete len:147 (+),score=38.97 gb/GFBE01043745.1/:1-441(+)
MGVTRLLTSSVLVVAATSAEDLQAACKSFTPPAALNGTVTWESPSCIFRCAAKGSLGCMTCSDGIVAVFQKADEGTPRAQCTKTMKPSEYDADVITQTCPDWKMVMDFHGTGKMGGMTVELDLNSEHALDVLQKAWQSPSQDEILV